MDRYNYNPDGTIDDVFIEKPDSIHIEEMDDGSYWMAIYKNGITYTVDFSTPRKLTVKPRS